MFGQATAVIDGPDGDVTPGNLVILRSTGSQGEDYQWKLVNSDLQYLEFNDTNSESCCVFSSGVPGEYVFVLAVSASEPDDRSSVSIAVHTVRIKGISPTPGPDKPTPGPDNPNPGPDNPRPPPRPELTGHAAAIFEVLVQIKPELADVTAISGNYKSTASRAAGLSWDAQQLASEFRDANIETVFFAYDKKTTWTPWAKLHSETMQATKTVMEAIEVFNALADGCDAYVMWKTAVSSVRASAPPGSLTDSIKGLKSQLDSSAAAIRRELGE